MTQLREDYSAEVLPSADVNDAFKRLNRAFKAGIVEDFFGLEADVPSGFLLASGKTIGGASSNATARANADMAELYAILWAVGNTDGSLVIYTSGGSPTTYGANAAADFAANKAIALPDLRGRTTAGRDSMGGTDAGRIVTNDAQGDKVGGVVGAEEHTLVTGEIPAHNHPGTDNFYPNGGGSGSQYTKQGGTAGTPTQIATANTGGGGAHNNMQPTAFLNKIICTGVTW